MTNLDSIFKSRDIALPTKLRLVKAMVFPVVMMTVEEESEQVGLKINIQKTRIMASDLITS